MSLQRASLVPFFPVLIGLALVLACNPSRTPSVPDSSPNADAAYGAPETPCAPHGAELTVLDEQLRPVDLHDEASLEAAGGGPVTVCAAVRAELSGLVLDSASRAPVPNAVVVVESWRSPAPIGGLKPSRQLLLTAEARTDARGAWQMPAARLLRRAHRGDRPSPV